MNVSDINIYIMEIVWWGLKRILSSRFRDTVNYRLQALGLYKFVRGFGWAYKRRGLYPDGLISGWKKNVSKLATALLIDAWFKFVTLTIEALKRQQ